MSTHNASSAPAPAPTRARLAHVRPAVLDYWATMISGLDPVPHVEELQRQAREWRVYQGLPLDCGSILFHLGEPFRFSANGTKIGDVVPGVVSITYDGFVHVAVGGDHDAGAEEWVLIYNPEARK